MADYNSLGAERMLMTQFIEFLDTFLLAREVLNEQEFEFLQTAIFRKSRDPKEICKALDIKPGTARNLSKRVSQKLLAAGGQVKGYYSADRSFRPRRVYGQAIQQPDFQPRFIDALRRISSKYGHAILIVVAEPHLSFDQLKVKYPDLPSRGFITRAWMEFESHVPIVHDRGVAEKIARAAPFGVEAIEGIRFPPHPKVGSLYSKLLSDSCTPTEVLKGVRELSTKTGLNEARILLGLDVIAGDILMFEPQTAVKSKYEATQKQGAQADVTTVSGKRRAH